MMNNTITLLGVFMAVVCVAFTVNLLSDLFNRVIRFLASSCAIAAAITAAMIIVFGVDRVAAMGDVILNVVASRL